MSIIEASDSVRDTSIAEACEGASQQWLLEQADALEHARFSEASAMMRVRALLFLHYLYEHRIVATSTEPLLFPASVLFGEKKFDLASEAARSRPLSVASASFLSACHRSHAFFLLSDLVRNAVKSVAGNEWLFDANLPQKNALVICESNLVEKTPVRLDLTHSCWSDIFFLAMDNAECARVINCSVNLRVWSGKQVPELPEPPVECYLRKLRNRPGILILRSVDLKCSVEISNLSDLFNFSKDLLGLLKAAVIAGGLIPPWREDEEKKNAEKNAEKNGEKNVPISLNLSEGIELVARVKDIPKGSRLAVSTTLICCIVACVMRATGQTKNVRERKKSEKITQFPPSCCVIFVHFFTILFCFFCRWLANWKKEKRLSFAVVRFWQSGSREAEEAGR